MKKLLISLVFITGCGLNGNQTFSAAGTTNANVNIVFQFINQIEDLCKMQNPQDTFSSLDLYNQTIATCTFNSLSLVQSQALQSNCSLPNLTASETQVCNTLGFL